MYEVASGLAARGHRVVVLHPRATAPATGLRPWAAARSWPLRVRWRHRPLIPWFPSRPNLKLGLIPDLRPKWFPRADAVIATAWATAEAVRALPEQAGRKLALVQDFEHWSLADDRVRSRIESAFAAPMTLVATGPAVSSMLEAMGRTPIAEIAPGVDPETFGADCAVDRRDPLAVGFPMRTEAFKGARDAIAAIDILRRSNRPVHAQAFGTLPNPDIPSWLRYTYFPDDGALRTFYNDVSVFLLPSHYEGWGLPALEAMACGAAVVSSDCFGIRPFARHEDTALVVPPRRADLLAAAVARLIDDDTERQAIAARGEVEARGYRWRKAVDVFEEVLMG